MIILSFQLRKIEKAVIDTIETSSQVLFNWFSDNFMKANSSKKVLTKVRNELKRPKTSYNDLKTS